MLARFTFEILPKAKDAYDCASCKGDNHVCYKEVRQHDIVGASSLPNLGLVNKPDVLDAVGSVFDGDALKGCFTYGICPLPFFTHDSLRVLDLYHLSNGTENIQSPAQAFDLPAPYVEACRIINTEKSKANGNI